jgi:hypothetical protein
MSAAAKLPMATAVSAFPLSLSAAFFPAATTSEIFVMYFHPENISRYI